MKNNFSERLRRCFPDLDRVTVCSLLIKEYPNDLEALNFLGDLGCDKWGGKLMDKSGVINHVKEFINKYLNKGQTIFILNRLLSYRSNGHEAECQYRREGVPKLKYALDYLGENQNIYSGEFDFIARTSAIEPK